MTLITPVGGKEFNWAPQKSGLTKQASTDQVENNGKDALYEAAKKVMAQFALDNEPCENPPCEESAALPGADAGVEVGGMGAKDPVMPNLDVKPDAVSDVTPKEDAVKVVSDLVEKVEKADQVSTAVQTAVEKVETALQGVKDAVGVAEVAADDAEIEVEVEAGGDEGDEGGEGEEADEVEVEFEEGDEGGEGDLPPGNLEGEGDEIVKESDEDESDDEDFEKEASKNDKFVKIAEISPENSKKLYTYWHDILGYPEDFCKLLCKK